MQIQLRSFVVCIAIAIVAAPVWAGGKGDVGEKQGLTEDVTHWIKVADGFWQGEDRSGGIVRVFSGVEGLRFQLAEAALEEAQLLARLAALPAKGDKDVEALEGAIVDLQEWSSDLKEKLNSRKL